MIDKIKIYLVYLEFYPCKCMCVCKCSMCSEGDKGSQCHVQVQECVCACVHVCMCVQMHMCSDGNWQWGQVAGGSASVSTCSKGSWGHLGWKVYVLSIPHDPPIITVDWGYPKFPEEQGTQDCIVPFNICNTKVYLRFYRSEFDGYPCPIIDFRAQACDAELECHLLLKLDGRGSHHGSELRQYHVGLGSSIQ